MHVSLFLLKQRWTRKIIYDTIKWQFRIFQITFQYIISISYQKQNPLTYLFKKSSIII